MTVKELIDKLSKYPGFYKVVATDVFTTLSYRIDRVESFPDIATVYIEHSDADD